MDLLRFSLQIASLALTPLPCGLATISATVFLHCLDDCFPTSQYSRFHGFSVVNCNLFVCHYSTCQKQYEELTTSIVCRVLAIWGVVCCFGITRLRARFEIVGSGNIVSFLQSFDLKAFIGFQSVRFCGAFFGLNNFKGVLVFASSFNCSTCFCKLLFDLLRLQ